MKVFVAEKHGFCLGVKNAINLARATIARREEVLLLHAGSKRPTEKRHTNLSASDSGPKDRRILSILALIVNRAASNERRATISRPQLMNIKNFLKKFFRNLPLSFYMAECLRKKSRKL